VSVKVGADATSWLQQDASESPADTMPDTTGDLSVFLWLDNLLPAVVLPSYKTGFVWFTTADLMAPDYADPYVWVGIEQVDGVQAIGMTVGTGDGTSTPFVTSGVEKRAIGVTYDGTSHDWKFYIRRTAAWELVGTVTDDWSGNTITQMRLLNDGISGSHGSMSCAYFRLWNGKKLTLDEFEAEATSAVAVTSGITTDTPLITVDDLTDVASSSGSQWYAVGTALETTLPGPLAGNASYLFVPESSVAAGGNPTFTGSVLATTTGSPTATISVDQIVPTTTHPTVAICGARDGGWWQACDNGSVTDLVKFDATGTITGTVTCAVKICNGNNGNGFATRSLMELDNRNLLSIVRSTGVLTEISSVDGTVVQSFGLTVTSAFGLDGAVSSNGKRLIFLDVTSMTGPTNVRAWDLENDVDLGTLFSDDADYAWSLVWLADCSVVFMVNTGVSMTPWRRYDLSGNLLGTGAYDETAYPASEQVYGITASVAEDRVCMFRDWDEGMQNEQPAVLPFKLSTTGIIGPQVPLVGGITDYEQISALGQPYVGIMCDPFPPTPTTASYPVRRLRRMKLDYWQNKLISISRIELKMQAGEGTVEIPNPQVMLRVSTDGGRTFGNLRMCSGGRMGEFSQRVFWTRFGQGRDWVAEFSFSDPVPWYLLELEIDHTLGTS
jgi:hypothetical protein